MQPSWADPKEYALVVPVGAKVGKGCFIHFPEYVTMDPTARICAGVYLSTGLEMGPKTTIEFGSSVAGGSKRKVIMREWSFIGRLSTIMATSEKYDGLIGRGFGAPGPCVEGDIVFERHSGVSGLCSVFPGVVLPEGAVVGAHSMVFRSKDLRPWWIHRGVPARPWKPRDKERVLREAEALNDR